MPVTRIKTNQVTDSSITTAKIDANAVTAAKLEDNLTYGSNLTVTGNLTVNGTTSQVNSTTMTVDDPVLLLSEGQTGSGAVDIGFMGERGDDTNVAFVFDESADEFVAAFVSDSDTSTTVTITDYADIRVGGLTVDDNSTIGGTLGVTGNVTLSGDITFGSSSTIDANTNKIINVTDPTTDQDAATKAYVDSVASAGFTVTDGSNSQTIEINSDTLTISGTANEITTLVSATDTLTIGLPDDVTIGDALTVTGNSTVGGTFGVTGATTLSSTLDVTGASTVAAITASGLASLDGGIDVDGAFTVANTSGNISTTGTLNADGNTTLGGTLGVTGATTLSSTVDVTGLASLDGGIDVDGAFTVANTSGNISTTGTLNVDGASTLNDVTLDASTTFDAGDNKLTNVADPTADQDAATKAYVDTEVAAGGAILKTAGDSGTDNVTIGASNDTLTFSGTANEITTAVTDNEVTISLPDDVTIGDALTVTGNGSVGGTFTSTGAATLSSTLGVTGAATLSSTLDVTGATTLSSTLDVTGVTNFNDTTGSTNTTSGAVIVDGGVGIAENLNVGGNTIITGNLTVNGTTTTVESTVTTIADPVMTLGDDASSDSKDRGIEFKYNDGSAKIGFFGWDNSADSFTLLTDATNSSEAFSGTAADFVMGGLTATTIDGTGNATVGGTLTVTGATDLNGALTTTDITVDASSTIDMGANKVTNVADPTANQDAATKAYVDQEVSDASALSITDGTTTDTVTVGTDTLTFTATANETTVVVSDNEVTIGLPDDVTIGDALTVTGNGSVGGTFTSTGAATLSSTLSVTGATTLSSTVDVTGLASLDGGIDVDGAFTVANTSGNVSTSGTLNADGNATLGGTLDVTGATTLSSTLGVTGESTLASATISDLTSGRVVLAGTSGAVEDSANLTFDGSTLDVTGDIEATGDLGGATATVTGNATVGGTLDVTGATTLSSTLDVTGASALDGGITVDTNAFIVANTSGNVTTAGTLDVAGLASLDGGIDVDGAFTVANTSGNIATSGTLSVTGATIDLDGAVTINDSGADVDFVVEGDTVATLFTVDAGTDTVIVGGGTATADVSLKVDTTDSFMMPSGTTAQRPSTPVTRMMRWNTTSTTFEYYDGSSWKNLTADFTVIASETFNGDDTTTAFTLSEAQTTASCIVSINGVVQLPTTAYGVSSTTLTFTEAPATGDVIEVRKLTTTSTVTGLDDGGSNATIDVNADGTIDFTGELGTNLDMGANKIVDLGAPTADGDAATKLYVDTEIGNLSSTLTIAADSGSDDTVTVGTDTLTFTGGTGIDTTVSNNDISIDIDSTVTTLTGTQTLTNKTLTSPNITGLSLGGTAVTSTAAEINVLDGATAGSTVASKAVVMDSSNDVSFGNDVTVSGNLTVSGTTTTVNSTNTTISDALIELNSGLTGANTNDTGIIMERGSTGNNAFMGWDESGDTFILGTTTATGSSTGNLTVTAADLTVDTLTGTATSAQYADLAEKYTSDAEYEAGTVVEFGGDAEITQSNEDGSRKIAGVISTDPAYMMNSEAEGQYVALTGRVPCKVTGAVSKGDMMVSAGNGMARAEEDPKLGSVIGKALEDFDGGEGVIEVVVGRM